MRRLRALWRSPVNRHAARVAAVAAAAGAAIFFLATLPSALSSSDQVAGLSDARLLRLLDAERQSPGTIQAQAQARWKGGRPLLWYVPAGGAPRSLGDPPLALPAELAAAEEPRTATIAGVAFRVAGMPVEGGRLVAAVDDPDPDSADQRLRSALELSMEQLQAGLRRPRAPRGPGDDLAWRIAPDGTVSALTGPDTPDLPAGLRSVEAPETAPIGGDAYRVAGIAVPGGRVIAAVPDLLPRSAAILDQLPYVPAVALAVFVIAFAIGRWAATPIEDARRRQLAFTADASHELRTPLAVIQAETSLALGRARDAAGYREALERVSAESGRLGRLVDDLLWLARFDASPPGPPAGEVDVGAAVQAAVERFRPVAAARGQALRTAGAPDPPARIAAPSEWLEKLLGVLLDNACRYSPDGGPIEVRVEVAGGHVRLAVDDAGPGIPDDERRRVFDRFHRAIDGAGGTGLGLAIADAVVRATHGRWEIDRSAFGGASLAVVWQTFTRP